MTGVMVLSALAGLTVSGVVGVSVASATTSGPAACTATSTATCAVTLHLTSGTWTVHNLKNTAPTAFPATATAGLSATEQPATGTLSTGTLTLPVTHESNQGSTETILFTQVAGTKATGSVTAKGQVTISVEIHATLHITTPVTEHCTSGNYTASFTSTAPYDASTGDVTVLASGFTIPDFSKTTCAAAASSIDATFSGSVGNKFVLDLHGTLVPPPNPTRTSVTTLTASPATGIAGQKTTLTATVAPATATGHVTFFTGTDKLGTGTLATLTVTGAVKDRATYTTTTLTAGSHDLKASYGGDGTYKPSNGTLVYRVQTAPVVNVNYPSTLTLNAATPAKFAGAVSDPVGGPTVPNARIDVTLSETAKYRSLLTTMTSTNTSLVVCTTSTYVTCTGNILIGKIHRNTKMTGDYGRTGGPTGFTLNPGTQLALYFKLSTSGLPLKVAPLTVTTSLVRVTSTTGSTVQATLGSDPSQIDLVSPNGPTRTSITVTTFTTLAARTESGTWVTYQGYDVHIQVTIQTSGSFPVPTGTITVFVASTVTGVMIQHSAGAYPVIRKDTPLNISTGSWPLGLSKVSVSYSGDIYHKGSTSTTTAMVTVRPAPSSTAFSCSWTEGGTHSTDNVFLTSIQTVVLPSSAVAGSTIDTSFTASMDVDVATFFWKRYVTDFIGNTTITLDESFGLSPLGSATGSRSLTASSPVTVPNTPATPATPNPLTAFTTVSVKGALAVPENPGTTAVTVSSLAMVIQGTGVHLPLTCVEVSTAPVTIGTIDVLAKAKPSVTTQPAGQSANVGTTATFTATASGVPAPSVQWQSSTDGGSTWTNVTGATSTSYTTPTTTAADNGTDYRAVFTNATGSVDTTAATLTVDVPPTVTTQPTSAAVTAGTPVSFTAAATARPAASVQWQVSTNGGKTFANVAGATSTTLTFAPTKSQSTNQYRAVFTNPLGSATTKAATLTVTTTGYRLFGSDGAVYDFGTAAFYGSMGGQPLNAPVVGAADTPTNKGYWEVASDGGIFAFGTAQFYGSMGGQPLNQPVVGMAATPTGKGYWEVAKDGGIFAFGAAGFYGSMGGQPLNQPIVGMTPTPTGKGYWLVASDGGIFAFGSAGFYGSTGSLTLAQPITGMAATPTGQGYWLVAKDGGIFAFGSAPFEGSAAGGLAGPYLSMAAAPTGKGYWLAGAFGAVTAFGSAPLAGSMAGQPLNAPIVGISG